MRRSFRVARWGAINAAVVGLAWVAIGGEVEWAGNVLRFYAWAVFAFSIGVGLLSLFCFVAMAVTEDTEDIPDMTKALSVPAWLDFTVDTAVALAMASTGWFITAAAFITHTIICHVSVVMLRIAHKETAKRQGATP